MHATNKTYVDLNARDLKMCVRGKRSKRGEGALPTNKENLQKLYNTHNAGNFFARLPLFLRKRLTLKMRLPVF